MLLKLENNLTKNTIILDNIEDKQTSRMFYIVDVVLPENIIEGEYTLYLIEDEKILSNTLVQIGDYKANNTEYNTQKKDTIVYGG